MLVKAKITCVCGCKYELNKAPSNNPYPQCPNCQKYLDGDTLGKIRNIILGYNGLILHSEDSSSPVADVSFKIVKEV